MSDVPLAKPLLLNAKGAMDAEALEVCAFLDSCKQGHGKKYGSDFTSDEGGGVGNMKVLRSCEAEDLQEILENLGMPKIQIKGVLRKFQAMKDKVDSRANVDDFAREQEQKKAQERVARADLVAIRLKGCQTQKKVPWENGCGEDWMDCDNCEGKGAWPGSAGCCGLALKNVRCFVCNGWGVCWYQNEVREASVDMMGAFSLAMGASKKMSEVNQYWGRKDDGPAPEFPGYYHAFDIEKKPKKISYTETNLAIDGQLEYDD